MTFGKLFWGGVTKYRLLPGKTIQRRTGVKSIIQSNNNDEPLSPSWLQYGGCYRNYDAMDIGSAGFIEITLLPKGQELRNNKVNNEELVLPAMMLQSRISSYITKLIQLKNNTLGKDNQFKQKTKLFNDKMTSSTNTQNKTRNDIVSQRITTSVGGLQDEIYTIIRRVLDGRMMMNSIGSDESNSSILKQQEEYDTLQSLGLNPVKGLLLYGPPGCGKVSKCEYRFIK